MFVLTVLGSLHGGIMPRHHTQLLPSSGEP